MHEIERRQLARVSYESTIYWAEFLEETIPAMGDFQVSDTSDLSPDGFSFFSPKVIESKMLLVSLASPMHASHLLVVRIRHCTEGFWNRQRKFRISCELITSVENPFLPANAGAIERIRLELEQRMTQSV